MSAIENVRDVFSIFHDGGIAGWSGNKQHLTLKIECQYLAERVDKSFDHFFLDLFNIDKIEFDPWIPKELDRILMIDFEKIFKAELEILQAEIKEDFVVVTCNQHNSDFGYWGGELSLSCESIKIYDQIKNELTIEFLNRISNEYWNEWASK